MGGHEVNGKSLTVARKDLRDGISVWNASQYRSVRTLSLTRDVETAVAIIGGGISGSLTALVLSEAGYPCAVFDRRTPGEGSTRASTAMIQFEIDTPLTKLTEQIGRRNAERAYLRSFKAVKDLRALLRRHAIDADWVDRDALYLAGGDMGFRGLRSEADKRKKIGLPSRFLDSATVRDNYGIAVTGAILSKGAAELDPAKTAAGCLKAAQALGAKVYAPCEIAKVESRGGGVVLDTSTGQQITCAKAIFATGYEVVKGIPRSAFDIVSSWAIATQPLDEHEFWRGRCLIWEAADPYLYLRTTADNRILAGGEDSGLLDPQRREAAIANKSEALIKKLRRLLNMPHLDVDYAWAGAFAESPTGLPAIRELDTPGTFAILGCGGNGITFSVIAAQMAKAWVAGRQDPDSDLFSGASFRN